MNSEQHKPDGSKNEMVMLVRPDGILEEKKETKCSVVIGQTTTFRDS